MGGVGVCYVVSDSLQPLMTPWTVAHQALLSMRLYRQVYWNTLPFPPSGDFPNPEIEPTSLLSPALADGFLTTEPPEKFIIHGLFCFWTKTGSSPLKN